MANADRSAEQFRKMTETPIPKLILSLAAPTILSMLITSIYNLADTFFVGQISTSASGAVGIVSSLMAIIQALGFMLGHGSGSIISRSLGSQNTDAATRFASTSFFTALVFGGIITAAGLLTLPDFMMLLGSTETILPHACAYARYILLAAPIMMSSLVMNNILRYEGKASFAMIGLVTGGLLNIALDPLFIFGLGMGVRGAALATVLSQLASCTYVLMFLFGKRVPIRITFGDYSWKVMKRVIKVGASPCIIIAMDNVLIISMNTVIQRLGGPTQGDTLLTCATIAQSFMLIVTMPLGGITSGTQTILGYNFGAKRPDRIWKAQQHILKMALGFTTIMFLLSQLVPGLFAQIFTRNPEYIELTARAIRISALAVIPLAVQYTIVDGFTGMGIAHIAISLSLFRKGIYLAGVFVIPLLFGITNVFCTEPVSDIISSVVSTTVYLLLFKRVVGDPSAAKKAK